MDYQPIRITQISSGLNRTLGGPSSVVLSSASRFRNLTEHLLIVFGQSPNLPSNCLQVEVARNNRYGFYASKTPGAVKNALQDTEVLLVHGFYLYSTLMAVKYSKTNAIFLMPHGSLEHYQEKKNKIRKWIFCRYLEYYLRGRKIHFLVASESEITSIRTKYPSFSISVVGLGIERNWKSDRHAPKLIKKTALFHLLCMSRITTKKRIDLCIKALKIALETDKNLHLHIVGTGDKKLQLGLNKLVKDLGIAENVTFHGFLEGSEKEDMYKKSQALLLTSENENFALSVAESIGHGKPVLVSNQVAMHKFVEMYKTGVTVKSLNPSVIATGILNLRENYSLFQQNCIGSRDLLNWDNVFDSWIEVVLQKNIGWDNE